MEVFARSVLREYLRRVQTDGASISVTRGTPDGPGGYGFAKYRWGRATYDAPTITLAFPEHLIGASYDALEDAARDALECVPLPR
jgi:hypothetical protein